MPSWLHLRMVRIDGRVKGTKGTAGTMYLGKGSLSPNPLNEVAMSFRVDLNPQLDKGLELLATAYQMSKSEMVKTLVIAAIANEPNVHDLMIQDFKDKLAHHAALIGEKVEA